VHELHGLRDELLRKLEADVVASPPGVRRMSLGRSARRPSGLPTAAVRSAMAEVVVLSAAPDFWSAAMRSLGEGEGDERWLSIDDIAMALLAWLRDAAASDYNPATTTNSSLLPSSPELQGTRSSKVDGSSSCEATLSPRTLQRLMSDVRPPAGSLRGEREDEGREEVRVLGSALAVSDDAAAVMPVSPRELRAAALDEGNSLDIGGTMLWRSESARSPLACADSARGFETPLARALASPRCRADDAAATSRSARGARSPHLRNGSSLHLALAPDAAWTCQNALAPRSAQGAEGREDDCLSSSSSSSARSVLTPRPVRDQARCMHTAMLTLPTALDCSPRPDAGRGFLRTAMLSECGDTLCGLGVALADEARTPPQSYPVFLHIYDVSQEESIQRLNALLAHRSSPLKLGGVFHAGVEVHGMEWSFGWSDDPGVPGVSDNEPRNHDDHHYRQTVQLLDTALDAEAVEATLQQLRQEYPGPDYDMFSRNCCHFADDFAQRLGAGRIPNWVYRLARIAARVDRAVQAASRAPRQLGRRVPWVRARSGRRIV